MRNRTLILIGALLLTSSATASAQQNGTDAAPQIGQPAVTAPLATSPRLGIVEFGVRGEDLTGDAARYNRFRDLREGLFMSRFKLEKETQTWFFSGRANNVGYRDQQYFLDFQNIGKVKASFEYNQVPLFISDITRSLYRDQGNGVLAIDDAIQSGIQGGTLTLTNALAQSAQQFDMRSRRDNARFGLVYMLNRDVDLKFSAKTSHRDGYNLMSFGLGTSPGLNPALEMGVPTDDRTTDINGSVVFANTKGLLSLGYRGSWYENDIPTVRFDNPLRATDGSPGAAVGQAALWPSNSSFAVDANASYRLPRRTRVSMALSTGRWTQDEPLVPPTVNTALVAPALPRATANTKADIRSALFSFNSRPMPELTINAKYRYYDYANKAEHFEISNAIIGDWANGTQHHETEPASFKRQNADIDVTYAPYDYLAIGVGAGREQGDRTFRIFEQTTENSYRVTFDSTGNQYVTLRAKYEHSRKTGDGFELHLLEEVGEQHGTRHYDVANRERDRFTTIVTVTPTAWLSLNGSIANGIDDYFATGFGLRDNENRSFSLGFDVVPTDKVSLGVNYGREKYEAMQYSRTANPNHPTFDDPSRDWWLDSADTVETVTCNLDLTKVFPKTDIRIGYDLSDGTASYIYNVGPDSTILTGVTYPSGVRVNPNPIVQLPRLKNELTSGRLDVQHFLRPNVAVGFVYWYEEYKVDDFALGPDTLNALNPTNASGSFASTLYSGYLYRPYKVHTGWFKVSYLW
jgi:MtrB/PioB family decaheme-associated outer membrane protein